MRGAAARVFLKVIIDRVGISDGIGARAVEGNSRLQLKHCDRAATIDRSTGPDTLKI